VLERVLASFTVTDAAILGGNVAVVVALLRKAWPVLRRLRDLLDDWNGEPARPGVPPRSGVMVRLESIEKRTEQLEHNGGSSLRDDISALREQAAAQSDVQALRDEVTTHLIQSAQDRAELWRALALALPGQKTEREDPSDGT